MPGDKEKDSTLISTKTEEKVDTSRTPSVFYLEDGAAAAASKDKNVKSPEEAKLVRKINWVIMPLIGSIIFVQFMDKSTLGFAGIMGIYADTGITFNEFGWLGSIFYIGYLLIQIPNQYLLQRVPTSKYLGSILIIWGACLACTALGKNFPQLAGLRFLLGFWEGSTYPATLYRRSEQVTWYSFMFMMNAACIFFGNLIAYGMAYMEGLHGLSAWKWCMIIWGAVTTVLGFLFFFFLADKPKSRWFRLTAEEEKIIDERTQDNAVVQNKVIKKAHIYEALHEPRLYCYFFISLLLNLQNGALTTFTSQIKMAMGFSAFETILLGLPNGVAIIILLAICSYLSRRYNEIGYVAVLFSLIPMVGAILLAAIPPGPAQLAGLYIAATSPLYVMLQTSISSNVSGYTKKIFYTSANLVAYCFGNFIGPLMLTEEQAPRYTGAMCGYVVADFLCALLFLYVRWSLARENKRREQLRGLGEIPPPLETRSEQLDLTDKEDLSFVYRP